MNDKFVKISLVFLLVTILTSVVIFTGQLGFQITAKEEEASKPEEECPIRTEKRIVRGSSLSPLIESGETVEVFFNYYDCNEVKRGDVVLYNYAGSRNLLIKVVRGVSGDSFELKEKTGGWRILINGRAIKNSAGEYHLIPDRKVKMLTLYEKSYDGRIPENAYLLLGESISGTTDSSRFGFVHKNDLQARVNR